MSAGGGVDLREWVSAVLTAVRSSPVGRAVVNSRAATTAHAFAVRCRDERVPGLAAETAFFVMLAIFPGFLIAASLLGVLDVLGPDAADRAKRQVVEALNTVLTDEAAPAIASVQDLFERRRGRLLTVATLGALVTLSGAFAVAVGALNKAYGATESRSWLHRRVLGMVMGLTTVVAVALALAVLVVGAAAWAGQGAGRRRRAGRRLHHRLERPAPAGHGRRPGPVDHHAVPRRPEPGRRVAGGIEVFPTCRT